MNKTELSELVIKTAYDISALEAVYRETKDDVFAFAYGIIRDFHLTEECVQETFIRLPRAAKRFRGDSEARTFILGIAKNTAREILRHENRAVPVGDIEVKKATPDIDGSLWVDEMLSALDEGQRMAVVLHALKSYSFSEISEIIGVPTGTVKSRYRRAMEILRDKQKEEVLQ